MDIAYDHVQEQSFSPSEEQAREPTASEQRESSSPSINTEFQEAFRAVSSSPWGSTIGGWLSQARKQGETFYNDLQKEASEAQVQATKGFTSLREQVANRTRGMSFTTAPPGPTQTVPGEEAVPNVSSTEAAKAEADALSTDRPESLPADIVKEAGSLVASLRSTAALKLKELQKAEDAADEALYHLGTNVRNFLRDAVVISAPDAGASTPRATELDAADHQVLFDASDPSSAGKKLFHSSRLDAQLHAIHTTAVSFTEDPKAQSEQWKAWQAEFDVDSQTDAIARDLERYEELRRAMELLVPEKVEYAPFWTRYYFLRKAIEEEEKRRKEMLKDAAADPSAEVGWDDDDDDDDAKDKPNRSASVATTTNHPIPNPAASASNTTLSAPVPSRSSHEDEKRSVADSDASYDMVSGATSRAAGSPREEKKEEEDEDWE